MKIPAHTIKGGDTIRHNGQTGDALEGLRSALRGGYYIPLVDGRQIPVATSTTPITLQA